ncbi:diguanylate cyclase [Patulibacter sp. NPDC049589]|uniref:diguanylate cyclase n=1 Tax=Patulibacter sp. NPDC049589 TaxID=3154731 RepID=UPI00342A9D08
MTPNRSLRAPSGTTPADDVAPTPRPPAAASGGAVPVPGPLGSPARLGVLERLGLLDGVPDDSFDRVTRMATRLTGVPVSLAVLVDDEEQVFVGQTGLDEPWASRRRTPLSHSFCQHVVLDDAPLVIADARGDARLQDHLAIAELGVVAYAGVPLVCDGETVGSLCLIDGEPRVWTPDELEVLQDLAAVTTTELSLRLAIADQRAAAERTATSEERYRSLVAAMSDGVVLQRADGTIEASNAAAERMLGVTAGAVAEPGGAGPGRRIVRDDGSDLPAGDHPVGRTLRTGLPVRDAVLGVCQPDGTTTWISVSTEPLFDGTDAAPYAVVSCLSDVTDRRDAESQRALHTREQEALRAVATLVASEAQPLAVFAAAAEHVANVCTATMSRVVRLEPDGTTRLVGAWGPTATAVSPGLGDPVGLQDGSAIAAVMRTRRPASVAGREVAPDAADDGDPTGMRAGAAAPIAVDGRFWGAISVGWEQGDRVADEDLSRVTRFADLVSLAVTGAEAREQLAEMAFTDHLTGLNNQRAFSDRLEEEVRRCHRYRRPLSLIVFDLDHFKLINDTHGHAAGNRALAEFATRLLAVRRGSDVIARVGGEEFAWMLPETEGRSAIVAAERARTAIADTPFQGVGRITSSVGICSLEDADDAQQLYRRADLALYWAKAAGRNTIVRYTPELIAAAPGAQSTHRLESAKTLAAVRALASAVDAKDPSTQRHSERVAELAGELARTIGWDPARVVLLHSAALVHDVGKIGVPDTILLKPAKLTNEEYEQVKTHAALGAEMVADLLSRDQVLWIRHHHERHDGRGYPDGIAAGEISEGAEILAVADAWDAMTVARPYGSPRPIDDAIEEMRRGTGSQFAPRAIEALLAIHERGRLGTGAAPTRRG